MYACVVTFNVSDQSCDHTIHWFVVTVVFILCALMLFVVTMQCIVISDSWHVIMTTFVNVFWFICATCAGSEATC